MNVGSTVLAALDDFSTQAADYAEATETETVTPVPQPTSLAAYQVNNVAARNATTQSSIVWVLVILLAIAAVYFLVHVR